MPIGIPAAPTISTFPDTITPAIAEMHFVCPCAGARDLFRFPAICAMDCSEAALPVAALFAFAVPGSTYPDKPASVAAEMMTK